FDRSVQFSVSVSVFSIQYSVYSLTEDRRPKTEDFSFAFSFGEQGEDRSVQLAVFRLSFQFSVFSLQFDRRPKAEDRGRRTEVHLEFSNSNFSNSKCQIPNFQLNMLLFRQFMVDCLRG